MIKKMKSRLGKLGLFLLKNFSTLLFLAGLILGSTAIYMAFGLVPCISFIAILLVVLSFMIDSAFSKGGD